MKEKWWQLPVALGALAFGLIALWIVVSWLVQFVSTLNPTVISSVIVASFSFLGGVVAITYSKRREIEEAHRERKATIYENFLIRMFSILSEAKDKNEDELKRSIENDAELTKFMSNLQRDLLLWGSPNVLKTFLDFRDGGQQTGETFKTLLRVDNLLRAIREDVGLSNRKLPKGLLVKFFLKDPTELDPHL